MSVSRDFHVYINYHNVLIDFEEVIVVTELRWYCYVHQF